jgi:hypothetical protein
MKYSGSNVADVAAGPQPAPGPDQDRRAAGPDPAQDEFLATLRIMLAVDHGQPQDRAATSEIGRLDIELLIVLLTGDLPPVRDELRKGLACDARRRIWADLRSGRCRVAR